MSNDFKSKIYPSNKTSLIEGDQIDTQEQRQDEDDLYKDLEDLFI